MLELVVVLYILLIFPIFININLKYSAEKQILEFNVKLFKFIKIFDGYVEIIDEGIIIHLNKRKAILIFYKDIVSVRKKFEPLKDYHIFKLNTTIKMGILNDEDLKLNLAIIYNIIFNIIGQCVGQIKPYISLRNNVLIYEKENVLLLNVKATFVFNILMVIISFIKIFGEKIIYAIKCKAQSN